MNPAEQHIPIRNESFAFGPDIPRHWHGASKSVSLFFDNLALFFPPGERFFIRAVEAHRHLVTDAQLAEDVRGFCGQEAIHRREHARYDNMLKERGYPVQRIDGRVQRLLDRAERFLSPRRRLAGTCALEHFTALMGETVLGDPRSLEGANETMAALWRWHAAEENEHKAVAFDVYKVAGGTYRERCSAMVNATVIFWFLVFRHQVEMMRADGIATSPKEWWALFKFLYVSPGGLRKIIGPYFQYFRPSFHPNDLDSSARIEAWKKSYEGSGGPESLAA